MSALRSCPRGPWLSAAALTFTTSAALAVGPIGVGRPVPGPVPVPAPTAPGGLPALTKPGLRVRNPIEEAKRSVVLVEQAGRAVATGLVLSGDGRVLTALSAVGDGHAV